MRYSLLGLAVLALPTGCWIGEREATGEPGPIDTQAGTFRGVGIGDDQWRMRAVLGPLVPSGRNERADPSGAGEHFNGPESIVAGGPLFRYESVSYVFRGATVSYVIVTAPGSKTERGVAIGDELDAARTAYPGLRCGTLGGGAEYRPYPACTGRVAPRHFVWFGGDPISNITLGDTPLGRF